MRDVRKRARPHFEWAYKVDRSLWLCIRILNIELLETRKKQQTIIQIYRIFIISVERKSFLFGMLKFLWHTVIAREHGNKCFMIPGV